MQGKVLGIPLVLVVLVLLIVGPLGFGEWRLSQQMTQLQKSSEAVKPCVVTVAPQVIPTVSPSPKAVRNTSTESGAVK